VGYVGEKENGKIAVFYVEEDFYYGLEEGRLSVYWSCNKLEISIK